MTGKLPRAVLLDLDDTILVFDSAADDAWRRVCERFAAQVDGATPGELLAAVRDERTWYWGEPARHRRGRLDLDVAWAEIIGGALVRVGIDAPKLARSMAGAYSAEREAAIRPFPGALEMLALLRDAGVALALVTNGAARRQRGKIERFGLEPFFDYILIEGEFGAGKPEERVYLHALRQLGSRPADAWMVGDKLEFDIEAPQRLGIRGVWIDPTGNGVPDSAGVRPDRIISSLAELLPG
jgi:putative hydrolase of the HAD superfamily